MRVALSVNEREIHRRYYSFQLDLSQTTRIARVEWHTWSCTPTEDLGSPSDGSQKFAAITAVFLLTKRVDATTTSLTLAKRGA